MIGGIALACIIVELIYIVTITQPASSVVGDPPQNNNGKEYQPVILFNEQDDMHLSGWYIPSENGAAVI